MRPFIWSNWSVLNFAMFLLKITRTATVKIHKKSLSSTIATYFQSSRTWSKNLKYANHWKMGESKKKITTLLSIKSKSISIALHVAIKVKIFLSEQQQQQKLFTLQDSSSRFVHSAMYRTPSRARLISGHSFPVG